MQQICVYLGLRWAQRRVWHLALRVWDVVLGIHFVHVQQILPDVLSSGGTDTQATIPFNLWA